MAAPYPSFPASPTIGQSYTDANGAVWVYGNTGWEKKTISLTSDPSIWQDVTTATFGAGTAASPSISFSDDPNTGIYRPGADQLAISTNGVGRLFVDASGNVGIGAAPSATLDARGTVALSQILNIDGTAGTPITAGWAAASASAKLMTLSNTAAGGSIGNGNTLYLASYSNDNGTFARAFNVTTGGTDRFWVGSNGAGYFAGSVGIGSNATAPDTTLYVRNTSVFDTQIKAVQTDSAGGVCAIRAQSSSAIIDLMAGGSTYATNYMGADEAGLITQATGDSMRFNVGGSYCRWTFGSSEAARLTSSGQWLVGTSSNTRNTTIVAQGHSGSSAGPAHVRLNRGDDSPTADSPDLGYLFFGTSDNGSDGGAWILGQRDGGTWSSTSKPGRLVFSTTADGASSPTEAMRITGSQQVLIGNTSPNEPCRLFSQSNTDTVGPQIVLHNSKTGTTSSNSVVFYRNSTAVGTIATTSTATAYNTSSDYRLKENVVAVSDGIIRLQQLKPSRFNFIADPDKTVDGFIAHEVQAVVPEAITGKKDAVDKDGKPIYQGIDQSKLVPLLTAALQEAVAKIESLEARLTAAGL